MTEPKNRLINTTPTEGGGVKNLPDDAPAPKKVDVEDEVVLNAEQLLDIRGGLEAMNAELRDLEVEMTGSGARSQEVGDDTQNQKAVDMLGLEGLKIEDGIPVLEVDEEQFREFLGLDPVIIPGVPQIDAPAGPQEPDDGAPATDAPRMADAALPEEMALASVVTALQGQVSRLTMDFEDALDEMNNLGEAFANESMSFATEDENLSEGYPYDDLSINLNSGGELQWFNWDAPDMLDATEIDDTDLFGVQNQDSTPVDELWYIRADEMATYVGDYLGSELTPPWPEYWYQLLDTDPDVAFGAGEAGYIPVVTDIGGGDWRLSLTDWGEGPFWELGGDEDVCYGEAIGDAAQNLVIDLDLLQLTYGAWEVTDATNATSKDTGALVLTAGGLGVEQQIWAGGSIWSDTAFELDATNFWSLANCKVDVTTELNLACDTDSYLTCVNGPVTLTAGTFINLAPAGELRANGTAGISQTTANPSSVTVTKGLVTAMS